MHVLTRTTTSIRYRIYGHLNPIINWSGRCAFRMFVARRVSLTQRHNGRKGYPLHPCRTSARANFSGSHSSSTSPKCSTHNFDTSKNGFKKPNKGYVPNPLSLILALCRGRSIAQPIQTIRSSEHGLHAKDPTYAGHPRRGPAERNADVCAGFDEGIPRNDRGLQHVHQG